MCIYYYAWNNRQDIIDIPVLYTWNAVAFE